MAVRAGLLLLAGLCLAAAPPPPAGAGPHVVLPVQLTAEGELSAARRLAEQGRWDLALPMLQALLDGSPQALVHDGGLYRPLSRVVNALLSASPPEALRNYALLYEPAARKLYERGVRERSAALLREASVRYLHAPSGVRAAGALGGLLMDEGRFDSALLVLNDTDAPALPPAERAPLTVREIICLAHLGRRAEADRLTADLNAAGVGALTVGGKSWEPGAFVEQAFATLAPPSAAGRKPAHPDVTAAVTVDLPPGAPGDSVVPAPPSTRAIAVGDAVCLVRNGLTCCVTPRPPAVKWSAQAPGWLLTAAAGGDGDEALTPYYIPSTTLSQWLSYDNRGMSTLSADDGHIYAVQFDPASLGFPETPWEATQADLRLTNQLSCLDAADGKPVWSLGGGLPVGGIASDRDYWFFTAPAVSGGRLYVLAALQGDLAALCLDARTGRIVWRAPVGPLESRQEVQRYWGELFLSDACPPAVADGIAVFPTGQGVVCAFDACDGAPRWVSPYPRAEALINVLGQQLNVPAGSWMPRPPVVDGNLCLIGPADGRVLVALSLHTGEPRWQTGVTGALALLGAADGHAYVQTRTSLHAFDLATGEDAWRCALPPAPGTGVLDGSTIYVPQADGVLPVDAATGRASALLPWPPGSRTFGNLSFCGVALVAAAPDHVTICPPAGTATSPDGQAKRQDLALARLRAVLDDPVATYLDLCRQQGDELRAGTLAYASFWTVLAGVVRERCSDDPALRQTFAAADLGRWSPFAAPGASPPPLPPSLSGVPTDKEAWTVDGYAVLPAAAGRADDPLLVVGKDTLRRVDPRDGRVLWSTPLPPQARPAGWNTKIAMPPRQYVGGGMPAYVRTPRGVMVALPAGFLSVDPADGAVQWNVDAEWDWVRGSAQARIPRQELVERARHGLPIPPGAGERPEPLDGFAAGTNVAARLLAGRGVQAVDPADGKVLLHLDVHDPRHLTGGRVAALGGGLAVLLPGPERLLYYDLHDDAAPTEWRFRSAGLVRSVLPAPDDVLYVADFDGVYRFDLARKVLTAKWIVEGGVDRLLGADERTLALCTLDGRLLVLNTADGSTLLERSGATPVWAEHSGDVLTVLDAAELDAAPSADRDAQAGGKGFALRALSLPGGAELWHVDWPDDGKQVMAPPQRSGGLYLLRSARSGLVRLAGVDAATGRRTFAVALEASNAPGPTSLLVRDGRAILGFDARLVALATEGGVE